MRRRAVLGLGPLLLAACAAEPTVCPAIGWPTTLAVHLAPTWPSGTGRAVEISCDSAEACGMQVPAPDGDPTGPAPQGLVAGTAEFALFTGRPETVVVTVLDADGEVLAAHEADLEWVRVGGTAECGGPAEAEVVVPAP